VELNGGAVRHASSLDSLPFLSTQLSLKISQEVQKMNTSQVSVSFKDMTVESTQEEGQKIGRTQRTLYREVMLEKYSHLVSMGEFTLFV